MFSMHKKNCVNVLLSIPLSHGTLNKYCTHSTVHSLFFTEMCWWGNTCWVHNCRSHSMLTTGSAKTGIRHTVSCWLFYCVWCISLVFSPLYYEEANQSCLFLGFGYFVQIYRGRFSSNDPAGWISCSNGVGMVLKRSAFCCSYSSKAGWSLFMM